MEDTGESRAILKGTAIVGLLTLLSRVLGFVREILIARLFGASFAADAYFVAFRIPNLLRSVFAEGALTSAFVPVISAEVGRDKESARKVVRAVATILLVVTFMVALLLILFAPQVVDLIAPGYEKGSDRYELCVLLTRIMLPYITCVSIVAMLGGTLNSVGIFGAAAFSQVVMNLVLIAGALAAGLYGEREASIVLAASVLIGGVIQILVQIPALRRSGLSIFPTSSIKSPAVREIGVLFVPALIGAAVYQISIFISTQLASVLEPGSVSWLSYADRLTQLPIGIFAIALSSVLLPTLSRAASSGNSDSFRQHLTDALRYSSALLIPATFFLCYFAEPIVALIFERGNFTSRSTHQTALAVQAFSLGIWSISCQSLVIRAFHAKKDTFTPTLVAAGTIMVSVAASLILMGPPSPNGTTWFHAMVNSGQSLLGSLLPLYSKGHVGLALSSSISFTASLFALFILISRRDSLIAWRDFLRATLESLLIVLGLYLVALRFPLWFGGMKYGWLYEAAILICCWPLFLWVIGNREIKEIGVKLRAKAKPQG